ncbi:DciA family protein [Arsukibacterium sp.]|uniref:DciA family protein n=1 Tax=Arsukibacterium sp. TaxID=1977258 RepID=UPI00299E935C|nr:DciA family protein [Arsukibacterium sp.]MDX1537691.1 DciA family protein [Arsukibacterium sp.]
MKRYSHKPKDLTKLFGQSSLATMQQQYELIRKLNTELCHILQLEQLSFCQVSSINAGRAVILCQSPGWANRLKMQRDAILDNFRQKILPDLAGIDIEVSPHGQIARPAVTTPSKAPANIKQHDLSDSARAALQQALEHSDDKVKQALARLLAK